MIAPHFLKHRALRFFLYLILTGLAGWFLLKSVDFSHAEIVWQAITHPIILFLGIVGFICDALLWRRAFLKQQSISPTRSIIACGLTLWFKYIPGKIWSLIGRPQLLKSPVSVKDITILSLKYQLAFFAPIPLFCLPLLWVIPVSWNILTACAGLVVLCIALKFMPLVAKQIMQLSLLDLLISGIMWSAWGGGFTLMALIIGGDATEISWQLFITYPVSIAGAIAALFAPGGIGVREYGVHFLLSHDPAFLGKMATLLLTSRIWFLLSEALFFCMAVILYTMSQQRMLKE